MECRFFKECRSAEVQECRRQCCLHRVFLERRDAETRRLIIEKFPQNAQAFLSLSKSPKNSKKRELDIRSGVTTTPPLSQGRSRRGRGLSYCQKELFPIADPLPLRGAYGLRRTEHCASLASAQKHIQCFFLRALLRPLTQRESFSYFCTRRFLSRTHVIYYLRFIYDLVIQLFSRRVLLNFSIIQSYINSKSFLSERRDAEARSFLFL